MLEQEALVYLDTKKIDAYSVYDKVKKVIGLYDLKNLENVVSYTLDCQGGFLPMRLVNT